MEATKIELGAQSMNQTFHVNNNAKFFRGKKIKILSPQNLRLRQYINPTAMHFKRGGSTQRDSTSMHTGDGL